MGPPSGKCGFLFKGFKKKDDSMAKLAALTKCWATYIPCAQQQAVPAAVETTPAQWRTNQQEGLEYKLTAL